MKLLLVELVDIVVFNKPSSMLLAFKSDESALASYNRIIRLVSYLCEVAKV